jgi:hypothetical protein
MKNALRPTETSMEAFGVAVNPFLEDVVQLPIKEKMLVPFPPAFSLLLSFPTTPCRMVSALLWTRGTRQIIC